MREGWFSLQNLSQQRPPNGPGAKIQRRVEFIKMSMCWSALICYRGLKAIRVDAVGVFPPGFAS